MWETERQKVRKNVPQYERDRLGRGIKSPRVLDKDRLPRYVRSVGKAVFPITHVLTLPSLILLPSIPRPPPGFPGSFNLGIILHIKPIWPSLGSSPISE